ncbi:MAG TPA: hypothetical protein VK689_18060, partial [Armatimonadota bacterium]|nr:hypothetical protein [Armatimonadota bacterium]
MPKRSSTTDGSGHAAGSGRGRATPLAPPPRRGFVVLVLLTLLTLAGLLPVRGPAAAMDQLPAVSPTGRTPKLLWTPQRQAVWNRMRAENHPLWQLIKTNADKSNTPTARYGDIGDWPALAYQITGDSVYAQKALGMIFRKFEAGVATFNMDFSREWFSHYVLLYDWLYPAMTPEQRAAYIGVLNQWADKRTTNPYVPDFPVRVKDSDQVIGDYFALVFLALATADENPRAGEWLNKPWMGGLVPTASDRATLRNAIRNYCEMAEGGQWVEGTQYNQGTTVLLFMGAEGVKTATGVDYFPEVTRFARQMARSHIWEVTPDRTQPWAWGDVEEERGLRFFRRLTVDGILAGLTQDDPQSGPYMQQFVDEWIDRYGYTGGSMPWLRMFYFYNPYAPRADYRALPKGQFGTGQGHVFFHDGWGANDSFFGAHMAPKQLFVDHQVWTMGNFQLYRRGEWAVTHPITYGGVDRFGEGANSMLLAGLSSVWERKEVVAQEFGEAGDYAYAAATNGGQQYEPPYPYQPPVFLHEWSRSLLYLPSRDKHSDTIVVFDRVNAQNPKNLPKLNLYRPNDQALINNAAALKQWVIHMPVPPTQTEEGLTWQTPGGQGVKVSTLLPVGQRRTLINEDELWEDNYT